MRLKVGAVIVRNTRRIRVLTPDGSGAWWSLAARRLDTYASAAWFFGQWASTRSGSRLRLLAPHPGLVHLRRLAPVSDPATI